MSDFPNIEQLNTLRCDRCGHTERLPLIEVLDDVPVGEMERLVQASFFTVKRAFGEQGWSISVGYDLCPTCCKSIGTSPGYRESDSLPEITVTPRAHKKGANSWN